MKPKSNDRAELVRPIAANRATFSDAAHIEALFHATVEDLTDGGVDARRVVASMLRAWVVLAEAQRRAAW